MRDKGITAGVQKSLASTKLHFMKQLEYLEVSYPEYYKAVVDFCTPYVKLVGDVYLVAKAISIKLYGNLSTYVSTTIPLLVSKVSFNTLINLYFKKIFEKMNLIIWLSQLFNKIFCFI
jgi:hypothetical protein